MKESYLDNLIKFNPCFVCSNMFLVDFKDDLVSFSIITFDELDDGKVRLTCNDTCKDGKSAYTYFKLLNKNKESKSMLFETFDGEGNTLINIEYKGIAVCYLSPLVGFTTKESNVHTFEVELCYAEAIDNTKYGK